jgi:hypothetical protein
MKAFISLILLFLILSISCFSQAGKIGLTKSDSLLIEKIKKANAKNYIGKLLNDYLSNEVLKKYKEWLPVDEPPGKIYAIILSYAKNVWVEVIFDGIHHQKKFNIKGQWNFTLLKKEKIYNILYSWEE